MKYFLCFFDFVGCSFSTLVAVDEMEPFRPATMARVSLSFTDLLTQDSLSQPVERGLGFPNMVRDPRAPAWPGRVSHDGHPVQSSSAMVRVNAGSRMNAGMGVGTRAMRPAISALITWNPFNNGSGAGILFLGGTEEGLEEGVLGSEEFGGGDVANPRPPFFFFCYQLILQLNQILGGKV
ncbi:hypothetical protein NE237_000673 [Protea cynaroides]|uniref:Uncharacterized protein n=1 Tax=Protea cynaroides TaxID=273540 RepID=A0A9Q0QXN9_9MAGN|nr:hypothetical protein NE237_000673 [Protea cynaroides]